MRQQEKKAIAAAILGNGIFGFSFMASKVGLQITEPMVLLGYRFLIAFFVLNLLLVAGKQKIQLKGKPLLPVLLLGLFEPILYFIFESYGIKWTTSAFSGAMIAMIPVVSMVFAIGALREVPKKKQVLFAGLSVVGVVLVSVTGESQGTIQLRGVFMLILTVLAAAGYNIIGRKISGEFTAFERTYVMLGMGSAGFGGWMLWGSRGNLAEALLRPLQEPRFVAAVLYLSIASSVLAYLALNYAMTYLPVAKSTAFANMTTVISISAGVLFLKEPFGWVSFLGAVMIIIGVYGVNKEQQT